MLGQLNRRQLLPLALSLVLPFGAAAETAPAAGPDITLVMAEQRGCIYCARWNAEIGPAYPNTPEGQAAPLRRVDIHEPLPADLTFAAPLVITPTFVLMQEGKEVTRMEGYPGDEFFWFLLQKMLVEAGVDHAAS